MKVKSKFLIEVIKTSIPLGAAIGLVRYQSNIYGSLNPMLALIFLAGNKLGKLRGALIALVATMISSIYCGFGPWVIMQTTLWVSAGILGGCIKSKSTALQVSCIYGFLFGVVMDIFSFYVSPFLMYPNPIAQVVGGLPYDIRYCVVTTFSAALFYTVEFVYTNIKSSIKSKLVHNV